MRQSTRLALFAALVICAGLLLYLPGLSGPLLFDDHPALTANELVKISGSSFEEWRVAAFSSNSGRLRRPVAMLSFAANHVMSGGFSPVALKAVNLAIHLGTGLALYLLCLAVLTALGVGNSDFIRKLIAITAAAIWLLHPLHVSTVLYAVQRMAQLSAFFVALGLWVFMHYRQAWAERGAAVGEVLAAALWLLLLTALATLSKENGILLPWLVLVLEVCIFRGTWAGRANTLLRRAGWVLLVLPVCALVMFFAVSPEALTGGYAGREFSLQERTLTQARLLWRYLGWICLPNINDMGFQHDDIALSRSVFEPMTTALALIAWLLVLVFSFVCRRRLPLLVLGLLFYLVGHSLESSVIPLEMVYEHRNYLPSMMVCLAIAAALVIPFTGSERIAMRYPVLGVLAVLSVLLLIRVQAWSDELTLFRAEVANHPDSSRSNYFYANALLRHYQQRDSLGLSEQEMGETLLLSRHYFERMYQANNRDVAALVMLYALDSQFFPNLQDQVDWLSELDVLLESRTLQASDWNALDTLFGCFAKGPCAASQQKVTAILDGLSRRYPRSAQVQRFRYRYLAAQGARPDELLPLLREAQALAPGASWPYYYLLYELARDKEVASMYDYAGIWLLRDRQRYDVQQIKRLFQTSSATGGADE